MPRRWAVPLAALAVLLALASLAWQVWTARPPVTGDAEWIWAELPERLPSPQAFYLVRDFQVPAELADPEARSGDAAPAPAPVPAPVLPRLLVQGDEEYVLHLNGRRLGSNRYRPSAPLDVYPLDGVLLPGTNRIAVELRSSRGAGGFLAALDAGGGDLLLITDRSWRVVRRYAPGLVEGWLPLPELTSAVIGGDAVESEAVESDAAESDEVDDGGVDGDAAGGDAVRSDAAVPAALVAERPISWGRPPVGRWGRPVTGEPRPTLASVGELCPTGPVLRSRSAGGEPPTGDPAPIRALFDFGRKVTGYLVVEHPPVAPTAPAQVSLFALGDEPLALVPAAESSEVPQVTTVVEGDALPMVTLPGRAVWTDVVPRTFRYAAVAGLRPPLSVAVLEIDPTAVAALPGALRSEAAEPGLAGLPPRPRRTPAEDLVRRRLNEADEDPAGME